MLFYKFGYGDVISARLVPQLSDSENFFASCWRTGGDGRDVVELAWTFEIIVNCTNSFHESRAVLVCCAVFNRRCFDAVVSSELTDTVICWKFEISQVETANTKTSCLRCRMAEFDGTDSEPRPGQNSQTKWFPASMTASGLQIYFERCFCGWSFCRLWRSRHGENWIDVIYWTDLVFHLTFESFSVSRAMLSAVDSMNSYRKWFHRWQIASRKMHFGMSRLQCFCCWFVSIAIW